VTIVLEGRYIERGDTETWRAEPGLAIVHCPFEAHTDDIPSSGARVLNLARPEFGSWPDAFVVEAIDEVIRAATSEPRAVWSILRPRGRAAPLIEDWPDELARAIRLDPGVSISAWARAAGLDPATVSRGFRARYGLTAARFRTEVRTHHALRQLAASPKPLADVAAELGFSDHAHLTRSVKQLTGRPPSEHLRINPVQAVLPAD
jgi:AraC-like DNA-binding protein